MNKAEARTSHPLMPHFCIVPRSMRLVCQHGALLRDKATAVLHDFAGYGSGCTGRSQALSLMQRCIGLRVCGLYTEMRGRTQKVAQWEIPLFLPLWAGTFYHNFLCLYSAVYKNKVGGSFMINRVAEVRKACGMSQEKLAARAGVSRPYLSQIETQKQQTVSNVVMSKIARALDSKIEAIFLF